MKITNKLNAGAFVLFIGLLFLCEPAFAMPWEGPLNQIKTSLTGNVARAIGVIALAVAGAMLAFGGELSEFAKRICTIVLALAVLLLAQSFIDLF
ncbi:MAG TPA: TrbC/VirB2 family protein [Burkholderiales bacterium]|jgi:type IV secretion system protein VirB2|nr:TrbC/VirB2 family protein [Burkholderiales bacterium]